MFHFFSAQELANIALKRADMLAQKYGKLNYHIGGKLICSFLFNEMDLIKTAIYNMNITISIRIR